MDDGDQSDTTIVFAGDSSWALRSDSDGVYFFTNHRETSIFSKFNWNLHPDDQDRNIGLYDGSDLAGGLGFPDVDNKCNNSNSALQSSDPPLRVPPSNPSVSSFSSEGPPEKSTGSCRTPPVIPNKVRKKGQKRVQQPRFAFVTKSEVDHLEDGYRWRKYGQKAVKNSPFPRSYYRCTNSRCTVKKRVERSSEDPTVIITTYEGQHCHHTVLGFPRSGHGVINIHDDQNFISSTSTTTAGQLGAAPLVSQLYYPKVLHELPKDQNPFSTIQYNYSTHHHQQSIPHHEVGKISHAVPEPIPLQLAPTDEGLLGDMVPPNMRNRS
uniref:WRKY42 n=1 Tax=Juglans sigillata TaxID=224355 RepID=A0A8K1B0F3_9ROSI|nr:WRKY42 [Juglans sigillata]